MNVSELISVLGHLLEFTDVSKDTEIRIGDVSEGDDLHCSVGRVVRRGGCVVLVPGDDDVWKDETVASGILGETLWPKEEESDSEVEDVPAGTGEGEQGSGQDVEPNKRSDPAT